MLVVLAVLALVLLLVLVQVVVVVLVFKSLETGSPCCSSQDSGRSRSTASAWLGCSAGFFLIDHTVEHCELNKGHVETWHQK